jgi:hypothetical protein
VAETVYEFGQPVKGTPKSRASIRTVILPELMVPELRRHLVTGQAEPWRLSAIDKTGDGSI